MDSYFSAVIDADNNVIKDQYYSKIKEATLYILSKTSPNYRPKIGVVLGSGLTAVGEALTDPVKIDYADIPGFPISTVAGHMGMFVAGHIGNNAVACLQGRFHLYEGIDLQSSVIHIYVLKALGCEMVLLTNAAGGVNQTYRVGDLMLITDHISFLGLSGKSPLFGPNDSRLGERFPSMVHAYSKRLCVLAEQVAVDLKLSSFLHRGVYVNVGGPQYESPAEIRMFRVLGGDAVGMSTVNEVIAARHCSLEVFAISLITNCCISDADSSSNVSHQDVLKVSHQRALQIAELLTEMVKQL